MSSIIQEKIVESIEHELSLADEFYEPQPMFEFVWFYPLLGIFLYADAPVGHYDIYEMIRDKVLEFVEIANHQGEQMVKYKLKK